MSVEDYRERISEVDREILAAVNRRIELVAELKRFKEEHGIGFVDPSREAQLLDDLAAANTGPLPDDELRAFFTELLALTKRSLP
jgi:chorismate mutase